jgi:hypothetical protein
MDHSLQYAYFLSDLFQRWTVLQYRPAFIDRDHRGAFGRSCILFQHRAQVTAAALDETAKYLDLAAFEVLPEAERVAGTMDIRARRADRATIASIDLTDALKGFANCRVRVNLTLRRGAIAGGVRVGNDHRLLAIEPVVKAPHWLSTQPTML